MITIDGSQGEGGGQVLRTSLGLSLVTGKAFRIGNIRARRKKPGLLRQHLTAVRAAEQIGCATVEGAALGSEELTFTPGEVRPGEYRFAVGSAGSATLVLQTVLPALMLADESSTVTLEGGTHNAWAPPFDFLQRAFLPVLRRMGPAVEVELHRPGFYPAGGGEFTARITPCAELTPFELLDRGKVLRHDARAVVSRLPLKIAKRELSTIRNRFHWQDKCFHADEVESPGPGNVVTIEIASEHVTEVFTGFGSKGVPAERVARGVAREADRYLSADVAVGEHLADQLLIPMALAGGGSFRTLPPSRHTETNIQVIERFLDVAIQRGVVSADAWQVTIEPR